MSPILKSHCIVISYMLTKIFRPIKPSKSDFKLKNKSLKVGPFSTKLSKINLYVLQNHGPWSQIREFYHVLERSGGKGTHQKNRLESRIPGICVTNAFTGVQTLFFSQNHHDQPTVGVRRHPEIAHKLGLEVQKWNFIMQTGHSEHFCTSYDFSFVSQKNDFMK